MNTRLITLVDNNFVFGAANLIYTFINYNKWYNYNIYIIDNDISNLNKNILNKIYSKLIYINIKSFDLVDKLDLIYHNTDSYIVNRYLKLNIVQMRDHNYLFVDSDCIFLNDAYDIFNSNYTFAALPSIYYQNKESFKLYKKRPGHFITSVLFIHQRLLTNELEKEISNCLKTYINYDINNIKTGSDQLIFNNWMFKHNKRYILNFLDLKYNLNISTYTRRQDIKNECVILHFPGRVKPWDYINNSSIIKRVNHIWIKEFSNIEHLFNKK